MNMSARTNLLNWHAFYLSKINKGEPQLQEVVGLFWFVLASKFQLNQSEKSEVTEMLGSPKQPFNLSLWFAD